VKNLSAQQWSTAAEQTVALRPSMNVTRLMSSVAYPTASMIVPVLNGLKDLLRTTNGGLDVLHDVFVRLLDEKFGDVLEDRELCAATVVDPRFKTTPFDDEECRQRTLTYMLEVEAMETVAAVATATPSSPSPQPTASSSVTSNASIRSKLDRNTAATAAPGRSRASAQHELLAC